MNLRNFIGLTLCCLLPAISCNSLRIKESDSLPRQEPEDRQIFWAAAVSFPEGYDWMRDSLGGRINAQIMLFRDSIPVCSLDAGPAGPIFPDGDLHSITDGHIFSRDYSVDGSTSLYMDGEHLFTFDGNENLEWIAIRDSSIVTLGSNMSNVGWALRENGEYVFGQSGGNLLSPLHEDQGELCFAWGTPITSSSGKTMWRYFLMRGNSRQQLSFSSDINGIYAIRSFKGKVHALASSSISEDVLWESGSRSVMMEGCSPSDVLSAELLECSSGLVAHIRTRRQFILLELIQDRFFDQKGLVYDMPAGYLLCSPVFGNEGLCLACSLQGGISDVLLKRENEEKRLPEKYVMISPRSFCVNEDRCCIALNDTSANMQPVIICGEDTLRFGFNGYFTELVLP